ncbi:hypothetical protein EDB86DRAFT_2839977 [Lactarius hatsudake]|nr:hypothetical protein EDB86DRAFT_2839977 [Lactarius hatsudake]
MYRLLDKGFGVCFFSANRYLRWCWSCVTFFIYDKFTDEVGNYGAVSFWLRSNGNKPRSSWTAERRKRLHWHTHDYGAYNFVIIQSPGGRNCRHHFLSCQKGSRPGSDRRGFCPYKWTCRGVEDDLLKLTQLTANSYPPFLGAEAGTEVAAHHVAIDPWVAVPRFHECSVRFPAYITCFFLAGVAGWITSHLRQRKTMEPEIKVHRRWVTVPKVKKPDVTAAWLSSN